MPPRRSLVPRLTDMIEAIERVRGIVGAVSLEVFEQDWQRQWMVQRGVEILSEASRHLTDELKSRHPNIPWTKVAGIGNVLRHGYEKHLGTYPVETRPRRPAVTGEGLSRGTDYGAGARELGSAEQFHAGLALIRKARIESGNPMFFCHFNHVAD